MTTVALSTGHTEVRGALDAGAPVDLAFAARSAMACFPATRNDHFDGHHVFYVVDLPARSTLDVTVTPSRADTDVSLYAYSVAPGTTPLPPNVTSAVACEASYGTTSRATPYNPGKSEHVKLVATTSPYRVVVGVAGARRAKGGAYTLAFDLVTSPPPAQGRVTAASTVLVARGGSATVDGNLDGGPIVDLAFASSSQVACFPATQNDAFAGAQVAYAVDLPPYTELTASVTPGATDLDLGLYGYTVAKGDTTSLPPAVPRAVSCESSGGAAVNQGRAESIRLVAMTNPYRAYIVVAGRRGTVRGAYKLAIGLRATR
ncbi:MAG: hypothetical protein JNM74_05065 [Myxococcales bacterium]|nr:hypothetical protein [Myxococcales bacterium]